MTGRPRPPAASVLGVLLPVVLTGCAGTTAPDAPAASADVATRAAPATSPLAPGEVVVLAAASLTDAMGELEARFEDSHPGSDVVLVLGPSSGLAQQVLAGSPGDVLVAAAAAPVDDLAAAGELLGEPVTVALNSPVLAVPAGNPGAVAGLADLADPSLVVSLCEPQVPCGVVTAELSARAGVVPAPDSLERDVRAVLTRLELGEADAGVVYRTDAVAAAGVVEVVEVPGADDVVTPYPAAVLAATTDEGRARAFLDLLRGPEGRAALRDAGFRLP